ncbi:MAG: Uma2 family endonuclease [Candidatus Binatia bacterium]
MNQAAPEDGRYSVERYFEMAECGILAPDDRVELLEGLIVAMAPQSPSHVSAVHQVQHLLESRLPRGVVVRCQASFLAGASSVPEPDIAVVPGRAEDYWQRHPSEAHLIVEVALSSLIQDRLTKSAIYAAAGIPCYWIVNLRDNCIEVFGGPIPEQGRYGSAVRATGSDVLVIDAFPSVRFEGRELLPPPGIELGPGYLST